MEFDFSTKAREMTEAFSAQRGLSSTQFMEELLIQYQMRHGITDDLHRPESIPSIVGVNEDMITRAFKALSVEKTGKGRLESFGPFIETLKPAPWFYHHCHVQDYSFLIVSEKKFSQKDINIDNPSKIKLSAIEISQATSWVYTYRKQVQVFWFDYGYFVFG